MNWWTVLTNYLAPRRISAVYVIYIHSSKKVKDIIFLGGIFY